MTRGLQVSQTLAIDLLESEFPHLERLGKNVLAKAIMLIPWTVCQQHTPRRHELPLAPL